MPKARTKRSRKFLFTMNDAEIIDFVNGLELRCPVCSGNVTISRIEGDNVYFNHNLYVPGQSIPSNETRCSFFNNDIKMLVNSYKEKRISDKELRYGLIGLMRRK